MTIQARKSSLSSDGTRVAIGNIKIVISDSGQVRIFELQSNNSWSQLGQNIDISTDMDGVHSVSSDGSIVAIGAFSADILEVVQEMSVYMNYNLIILGLN